MKPHSLYWGLVVLLFTGCRKGIDPNVPPGLAVNQVVQIDAGRSYYVKAIADSRCPIGVSCIWQGVAEVTLVLKQGSLTDSVRVASFDGADGLYKRERSVVLDKTTWTVNYVDVLPYPDFTNDATKNATTSMANKRVQVAVRVQ